MTTGTDTASTAAEAQAAHDDRTARETPTADELREMTPERR